MISERLSSIPLLSLSEPGSNPFLARSFYQPYNRSLSCQQLVARSYNLPVSFPLEGAVSPYKNPPMSYFCAGSRSQKPSLAGFSSSSSSQDEEDDKGKNVQMRQMQQMQQSQSQSNNGIEQRRKQGAAVTDILGKLSTVVSGQNNIHVPGNQSRKPFNYDVKHLTPENIISDIIHHSSDASNRISFANYCRDANQSLSVELLKLTQQDKDLFSTSINFKFNADSMVETEYSPLKSQFTVNVNKKNSLSPQRSPVVSPQRNVVENLSNNNNNNNNNNSSSSSSSPRGSPRSISTPSKQHVMLLSPPIRLAAASSSCSHDIDSYNNSNYNDNSKFSNNSCELLCNNHNYQPPHPPVSFLSPTSPRMQENAIDGNNFCNQSNKTNSNNANVYDHNFKSTKSSATNRSTLLSPNDKTCAEPATSIITSTPLKIKTVSTVAKNSARKQSTPYTSSFAFEHTHKPIFSSEAAVSPRHMNPQTKPDPIVTACDSPSNSANKSPRIAPKPDSPLRSKASAFGGGPSRSPAPQPRSVGTKHKLMQSLQSSISLAMPDLCDPTPTAASTPSKVNYRNIKSKLFSPL